MKGARVPNIWPDHEGQDHDWKGDTLFQGERPKTLGVLRSIAGLKYAIKSVGGPVLSTLTAHRTQSN